MVEVMHVIKLYVCRLKKSLHGPWLLEKDKKKGAVL
jgi:hypothetical protein